jgi:hypothetical protein
MILHCTNPARYEMLHRAMGFDGFFETIYEYTVTSRQGNNEEQALTKNKGMNEHD